MAQKPLKLESSSEEALDLASLPQVRSTDSSVSTQIQGVHQAPPNSGNGPTVVPPGIRTLPDGTIREDK